MLSQSGVDVAQLIDAKDEHESEENADVRLRNKSRSSIGSIHSSVSSLMDDDIFNEEKSEKDNVHQFKMEQSSKGKVEGNMLLNYFRFGGNLSTVGIIFLLFIGTQIFASGADKWVSYWIKQEELRILYEQNDTTNNKYYLNEPAFSTDTCIYIHGGIILCLTITGILRSIGFFRTTIRASKRLHNTMFTSVISTTMRFFNTNPSGRILNRFSKDIGSIDELLPKPILDAVYNILNLSGVIIITLLVNPIFFIPIAILSVLFHYIRKIYLKSSKNIKRLEGISKFRNYLLITDI